MVDKDRGELMIQEQSLPQPRKLENLMLCNTRACKPDFIDRNYCFRVNKLLALFVSGFLFDDATVLWCV